jgi:hypothetical protein
MKCDGIGQPTWCAVAMTPAHVYTTATETGFLTRLDLAAYLGRELARAEAALTDARSPRPRLITGAAGTPTAVRMRAWRLAPVCFAAA